MVGREHELALLRDAFDARCDERACQLVTVLGPAGIGKSRLVNELVSSAGRRGAPADRPLPPLRRGNHILAADGDRFGKRPAITRSLPASRGRERLERLVGAEPEAELVVERLAAAIGLSEGSSATEEIFWAVRRLLETWPASSP